MDALTIRNLDEIEDLITERLSEVVYVTVVERLGTREDLVARLTPTEPGHYDTVAETLKRSAVLVESLRRELVGIAAGPHSSFRVTVYGAKSEKLLTRSVTVLDSNEPASQLPTVAEIATEVEGRAMRDLGAAWKELTSAAMGQAREFGAMCLDQMRTVDEISRKQAELTAKETAAARAQVNVLVREVSSAKVNAAENQVKLLTAEAMTEVAEQKKQVEAERSHAAQEMAKEAIGKIGELGTAFLVSKTGMSPEMAEVANALQNNPEMVEALADPKVREQLKNPDNLSYIAASLKQTVALAEAAKKAEEAAEAPAAPASTPSDSESSE